MIHPRLERAHENYSKCKWCDAKDICLNGGSIEINCRTCKHVDMLDGGVWQCTQTGSELTLQEQEDACGQYRLDEDYFS